MTCITYILLVDYLFLNYIKNKIHMLTGFQFRASRALMEYTFKDISDVIGVHEGTLIRFGLTKNLEYIRGHSQNVIALRSFFEDNHIIFPSKNTITLGTNIHPHIQTDNALTCFQLKVSRIATGLTQDELSVYVRLSSSSISLLERKDNTDYISSNKIQISILKQFFERLGIIFPNDLTVELIKDPQILMRKNKNNS